MRSLVVVVGNLGLTQKFISNQLARYIQPYLTEVLKPF
jgi:hypothetical protein